jgi:ketosteroid isomerase-like protein
MRKPISVLVVVVACGALALGQAKKSAARPEMALLDLERSWAAANMKGDAAAVDRILGANWMGTSTEGTRTARAKYLADFKKERMTKSELSDMAVLMLSPTAAVVTGMWTAAGTGANGEKVDMSTRWTDVFTSQNGKWLCVLSQNTLVKK